MYKTISINQIASKFFLSQKLPPQVAQLPGRSLRQKLGVSGQNQPSQGMGVGGEGSTQSAGP